FAAGVNKGLARALAGPWEWTLLVNNDATVAPDALPRLVAAAGRGRVGLLAPTIFLTDRPRVVWPGAGWRRPITLAAFDSTANPPARGEAYDVDWAAACCLLVRRGVWDDVGLLDEAFWFYYEDHDLCLRAQAAGWRILHVPGATAHHRVASSTGLGTPGQMYLLGRSSVAFFARHTAGWQRTIIVPYRLGSLTRVLLASLVRRQGRSGWAYLRGVVAGLADLRSGAPAAAPAALGQDQPVRSP
ncbi:MAG: glycosyltransferase, partial [Anaerolineae bacterium]